MCHAEVSWDSSIYVCLNLSIRCLLCNWEELLICKMLLIVPCKISFHLCNLRIHSFFFFYYFRCWFHEKVNLFGSSVLQSQLMSLSLHQFTFQLFLEKEGITIRLTSTKRCSLPKLNGLSFWKREPSSLRSIWKNNLLPEFVNEK